MNDLKIISSTEKSVVYKLGGLSALKEKAVEDLEWADGLRSKIFAVTGKTGKEQEILGALPEKSAVWGLYAAAGPGLIADARAPFLPSIRRITVKKQDEIKRLYLNTRDSWYRSRNEAMTPRQAAEAQDFIERFLPESRHVYFEKSRKPAGLLMLNEYRDYLGRPADMVPWVWVEPSLKSDERRVVHAAMTAWLAGSAQGPVQAYVASSNIRAQKFFRKLGFRLEAVCVLKGK